MAKDWTGNTKLVYSIIGAVLLLLLAFIRFDAIANSNLPDWLKYYLLS